MHCKRMNGTERAWFRTRAEADRFAADPANWPTYQGDIPMLCAVCDFYHLNRPDWLLLELTHQDAALLASMGVAVPEIVPGGLRCAQCDVPFRTGIDFMILPDGKMVCANPHPEEA